MMRHWIMQAACAEHPELPAEAWTDKHGAQWTTHEWNRRALRVCQMECPVRLECLTDAMAREGRIAAHLRDQSILGGMTPKERYRLAFIGGRP